MALRKHTDDELLDIMKRFSREHGLPTQRKFRVSNGLPSYGTYVLRFGSFQNAIRAAEIEIAEDRQWLFERVSLSDDELLDKLKKVNDTHIKSNIFLMTLDDIDKNSNLPSSNTYTSRFGTLRQAYTLIGIDSDAFNKHRLESDMIVKYKSLADALGRVPNSRDIHAASLEGLCYGITTYTDHFGTLHKLQEFCQMNKTRPGRDKTNDEMIDDLKTLHQIIGRVPSVRDIQSADWMASKHSYWKRFGHLSNAMTLAGLALPKRHNFKTKRGTNCLSIYEFRMARIFEDHKISFIKEFAYRNVIPIEKAYRFDYKIEFKNQTYFIEIFGILKNKKYDIRKQEKLDLCASYNVPLLTFEPNDFKCKGDDLFYVLLDKVSTLGGEHYQNTECYSPRVGAS